MPTQAPNPSDYFKSHSILDVLSPFKNTSQMDMDAGHRYRTDKAKFAAQQAQLASQQQSKQLVDLLTRGGMSQEQIARIQAANMMNPDKAGESFATHLEATTLNEGDQRHTMFGGPVKNVRTPTPLSPEEIKFKERGLEIDRFNADTNRIKANKPTSPLVQIGADGQRYSSVSDVPIGQPIPEKLLGGVKLPEGMFAARVEGGPGFEFQPIPGSAAESKVQSREDSSTIDTLINDYATLAGNKAITSRGNSASDNAAAIYSGSFLGRKQDQLGGDVGNIDNY